MLLMYPGIAARIMLFPSIGGVTKNNRPVLKIYISTVYAISTLHMSLDGGEGHAGQGLLRCLGIAACG